MTTGGKAPMGAAQRVPASGGVGVASRRDGGDAGRRLVGPPERAPASRRAVHGAKELGGGVHGVLMIGRERRTLCGRRHAGRWVSAAARLGTRRRPGFLLWKPGRLTVAVETAGIEPASAIAHEVASTSVSGALFSSRSRLAGGVPRDQPPEDVPSLAEADRPGLSRHLMQAFPAAGRRGPTAHGLASG